jgi:hypothetical protein
MPKVKPKGKGRRTLENPKSITGAAKTREASRIKTRRGIFGALCRLCFYLFSPFFIPERIKDGEFAVLIFLCFLFKNAYV